MFLFLTSFVAVSNMISLFLGWSHGEPFHVVTALDPISGYGFVITVYRLDLDHFETDYKTRR